MDYIHLAAHHPTLLVSMERCGSKLGRQHQQLEFIECKYRNTCNILQPSTRFHIDFTSIVGSQNFDHLVPGYPCTPQRISGARFYLETVVGMKLPQITHGRSRFGAENPFRAHSFWREQGQGQEGTSSNCLFAVLLILFSFLFKSIILAQ